MQLMMHSDGGAWPLRRSRERPAGPREAGRTDPGSKGVPFERVRQAVLDQFSRHAFHKVGMREVARAAGCGMAALYQIAPTKDQLVAACLAADFEARAGQLKSASRRAVGTRQRLRACIAELVRFDLDRPDFVQIVRLNTPLRLIDDAAQGCCAASVIEEILARGVRDGSVHTDLDPSDLAALVCALADGALARWARSGDAIAPAQRERLVEQRTDLIWAMIWPAVCAS
jgi:AcrR family transcriptional regulator